jgi:hypothetical protein
MNKLNLALRLLLELIALFIFGYWGWHQDIGIFRFGLAVVGPVLFAAIWYTFNVRDDPSRSGEAPVPVPGALRLSLELILFALAAVAAYTTISKLIGLLLGTIVLLHYLFSYKRVVWMLKN